MSNLLFIFIALIAYKLISNLIKMLRLTLYKSEFNKYLSKKPNHIDQYKLQIIRLFKEAGILDTSTPISQRTGYGQVADMQASVFANFPSTMIVIAEPALKMFENAIGLYRARILESISPLFWIELLIFLPKSLLTYIGFDTDKAAIKLCNVLLTAIWWVAFILFTYFKSDIINLTMNVLGNSK